MIENLADLLRLLEIKTLDLKQYKADGSYMATVMFEGKERSIYTTKKSGDNINLKSPVSLQGGKIFVGEMAEALNTITIKLK